MEELITSKENKNIIMEELITSKENKNIIMEELITSKENKNLSLNKKEIKEYRESFFKKFEKILQKYS